MTRRGLEREYDLCELLGDWGWQAYHVRHGPVDVLALGGEHARWESELPGPPQWHVPIAVFCQVKSTAGGPYERFGRQARHELIVLAADVGAIPVLAWWPPSPGRGKASALRFLWERDWPTNDKQQTEDKQDDQNEAPHESRIPQRPAHAADQRPGQDQDQRARPARAAIRPSRRRG